MKTLKKIFIAVMALSISSGTLAETTSSKKSRVTYADFEKGAGVRKEIDETLEKSGLQKEIDKAIDKYCQKRDLNKINLKNYKNEFDTELSEKWKRRAMYTALSGYVAGNMLRTNRIPFLISGYTALGGIAVWAMLQSKEDYHGSDLEKSVNESIDEMCD